MDEDDGDPVDRPGLLDPCLRAARVRQGTHQPELYRHVLCLAVGLLGEGDQEGNDEERGEEDEEGDPQAARPTTARGGSRFDGVRHVSWLRRVEKRAVRPFSGRSGPDRDVVGSGGGRRTPLVVVRGGRLRGCLERRQLRLRRVEVIDGARVPELHEPAPRGCRQRLDQRARHQAGVEDAEGFEVDDRDQDRPAGLAAERRPHDRGAVCPVGIDERGHRLGVDPAHARGQTIAAPVSVTSARARSIPRQISPRDPPPRWPGRRAGRSTRRGRGRLRVGVGRDDDDRQGPAGPRRIDEPPGVGDALHLAQGARRGGRPG